MYQGFSLRSWSETATNMLQAVAGHLSIEAKMSLLLRSFPNKKKALTTKTGERDVMNFRLRGRPNKPRKNVFFPFRWFTL
jgi:hypothetical protein